MYELSEENFTRIVVEKIEELGYEVVLDNPDIEATYPCIVCNNTMSNGLIYEDTIPARKRMGISLEVWATSKYQTMSIMNEIIIKLRDLNILPSSTPTEGKDENTNKYRKIQSFEVFYNGLTNSFEKTK